MKMNKIVVLILFAFECLSSKPYAGAELRTNDSFIYGRFETRMKSSYGSGQLNSFFTYHDNDPDWYGHWNEIDFEIMGVYERDVQVNAITFNQSHHVAHLYADFNPGLDFHTYAFEWTPDYIAWFIDGEEIYRQTGGHVQDMIYPQKIMMNLYQPVYENWAGKFNEDILPRFAYYDWVSYAAYSKGSGDCGTDNNFTQEWKDEFLSWDAGRWSKATHTFDGNNADFVPENCVFQDGMMILCLTDPALPGYQDTIYPKLLGAYWVSDYLKLDFSESLDTVSLSPDQIQVNGAEVQDFQWLPETNTLFVKPAVNDGSITLSLTDIRDDFGNTNTSVKSLNPGSYDLVFPLKINIGGDEVKTYAADNIYSHSPFGSETGDRFTLDPGNEISGSFDDEVFLQGLQNIVEYQIDVENGVYSLTLFFSEHFFWEAGRRVFDVHVEGNLIEENLDIYAKKGHLNAYYLNIPEVIVNDNCLDIHFFDKTGTGALLNALQIQQLTTEIQGFSPNQPELFRLEQYPNPFNSITEFEININQNSNVRLEVYSVSGRQVATLVDSHLSAGKYIIPWSANVSSGLYFALMTIDNNPLYTRVNKCILLK